MRLTLRTLLAHLDKKLEADDEISIAAKLKESEFAANLVRRITACISSDQISAPSPLSTSTADDANRIGEYLDNVLSSEQVAEIERICLESEGHLAEVAACHQILSNVLNNPAEIPPALRNRVIELGRLRDQSVASANGEQTKVAYPAALPKSSVPTQDAVTQAIAADLSAVPAPPPPQSVTPVGLDDSGVSNAPTRLREATLASPRSVRRQTAMAGAQPINAAEASEIFGRPSRVVPWLVSLALIAAFLLVAVQAFSPLLRKGVTLRDDEIASADLAIAPPSDGVPTRGTPDEVAPAEVEVPADAAPPMVDLDRSPASTQGNSAAATPAAAVDANNDGNLALPSPKAQPATSPAPPAVARTESVVTPADPLSTVKTPGPAATDSPPAAAEMMKTAAVVDADASATLDPRLAIPASPASDAEMDAQVPGTLDAAATELTMIPGTTLLSDESLLLIRAPGSPAHFLAKQNEPIPNGSELICPPLYRDRVSLLGALDMTMVGPTKLTVAAISGEPPTIRLTSGRLLIAPLVVGPVPVAQNIPDSDPAMYVARSVRIDFADTVHELSLEEPAARAALDVAYVRSPGSDPEEPQSSFAVIEILAVQGPLLWTAGDQTNRLETGEMLRWSPPAESTKVIPTTVPAWIDAPAAAAAGAIDASAREGLLSLVRPDESIEMSLREAIAFRRAEVGALAAQTLALLERPSVYFGAAGVFSDVKQKTFWPDHFKTITAMIDRDPESAALVREAINQMDAAESTAIYRLLWLFSNAQLEAGSDELLVMSLDHANMTVRVLATENLRQITGTTLFFKPENETAPRRSSDIKKWETRLRKGEIRWGAP